MFTKEEPALGKHAVLDSAAEDQLTFEATVWLLHFKFPSNPKHSMVVILLRFHMPSLQLERQIWQTYAQCI